MKTIINYLTEPIVIANPPVGSDTKVIMYIYSDAFTKCDCGKDIMLSKTVYGSNKYTGSCSCGRKMELLNGKFKIQENKL